MGQRSQPGSTRQQQRNCSSITEKQSFIQAYRPERHFVKHQWFSISLCGDIKITLQFTLQLTHHSVNPIFPRSLQLNTTMPKIESIDKLPVLTFSHRGGPKQGSQRSRASCPSPPSAGTACAWTPASDTCAQDDTTTHTHQTQTLNQSTPHRPVPETGRPNQPNQSRIRETHSVWASVASPERPM